MPHPLPPPLALSLDAIHKTLGQTAAGAGLDLLTAPWETIAQATREALGGRFNPTDPAHRLFQLRLGVVFGERMARESNAFWFRQRDAVGGFALGMPEAVFTVSPFAVTAMALVADKVAGLSTAAEQIGRDRGRARADGAVAQPLTPADYERFFDPAYLEFYVLDTKRAAEVWQTPPGKLLQELRDAALRVNLDKKTRAWMDREILSGLSKSDPNLPLIEQAERDLPLVERVGELFAGRYGTGLTHEDGWANVALRLLQLDPAQRVQGKPAEGIGALATFLTQALRKEGMTQDGVLGLFARDQLSAPHPALAKLSSLRTFRVNPRPLLPLLQRLDLPALRNALAAFLATLPKVGGKPVALTPPEQAIFDQTLTWLEHLRDSLALATRDKLDLCLRRAPEIEGYAGAHKAELRRALASR